MKCGFAVELRTRPFVLLRKDVARPRVHAAVIIGDLEPLERILHARPETVLADRLLDPVERVNGLDLAGLVSLVSGFARQSAVDLARIGVIREVVFRLFQVVIAAVARRHDGVEAHLFGDREIPRRQIGLQFGVDILDLHRPAAIPVVEFRKFEAQRLAKLLGGTIIGVAGPFQRATGIVGDFLVLAAHCSAPCADRPNARRSAALRSSTYSAMAALARPQPRVRG